MLSAHSFVHRTVADHFFSDTLFEADPEIAAAIAHERERQQFQIELIASENIVSRAVLEAQGSVMTNKYAEGYPGRRYYGARPNLSGKWFNAVAYGVRPDDGRIDFDEVERLAEQHRPKLIIAGGSAYSRIIDFPRLDRK